MIAVFHRRVQGVKYVELVLFSLVEKGEATQHIFEFITKYVLA